MIMKKYIAPSMEVHQLEAENMLALSAVETPTDKKYDVLSNRYEEDFSATETDFWGNEL